MILFALLKIELVVLPARIVLQIPMPNWSKTNRTSDGVSPFSDPSTLLKHRYKPKYPFHSHGDKRKNHENRTLGRGDNGGRSARVARMLW